MMSDCHEKSISIGWGWRDVTPTRPVALGAQFHRRISEGVDGPVTVTAMALTASPPQEESLVFVSVDAGGFRHQWYDANDFLLLCHQAIQQKLPEIELDKIIINATHTHTAPNWLVGRFGSENSLPTGVMNADEYLQFFLEKMVEAIRDAWDSRQEAGISWGLGTAVVGHNRRATYYTENDAHVAGAVKNGFTKMYGNTNDPLFSHIEGYEDHYVDLLYTWDRSKNLTGVIVNLACPSQETEGAMAISADFWHEVRAEIRNRLGRELPVLAQCSAAGDQSPHRLWYKEAEERMLRLRGLTMRQEIGRRVAETVADVLIPARSDIRYLLPFQHLLRNIELPRRMVTIDEAEAVRADLEQLRLEEAGGKNNFRVIQRCLRVLERFEQQKPSPTIPMQLHVIRLGDIAFASNRFELFLDYGIRIKARSPATQTFLIQLAADYKWNGTYLPSERAVANKGYGGAVYDNEVGPEGGQKIVEETVRALSELWGETDPHPLKTVSCNA